MLRVMTLNINGSGTRQGPWQRRRELICQIIQEADPDVIALQAVCQDAAADQGGDQASQLARRLPGYQGVFFPAGADSKRTIQASAFLARPRMVDTAELRLSRQEGHEDRADRALLYARFDLASGPLHLFNAHFSWVLPQALDHVNEVIPYLDRFTGPRMMLGDLNNAPDSEPMRRLARAGWHDVWAERRAQDPGYTFESGDLTKRIDYVWVNAALRAQVEAIETVADRVDREGNRPSDHLGLLVTLSLDSH